MATDKYRAVYLKAAENIAERIKTGILPKITIRSCWEVSKAASKFSNTKDMLVAKDRYISIMLDGCQITGILFNGYEDSLEAHEERILLLCFMATVNKDFK